MAGVAFNGYCYPNLSEVLVSEASMVSQSDGNTIITTSYSVFLDSGSDHIGQFMFNARNLLSGELTETLVKIRFYDCPVVGPLAPSGIKELFDTYFLFDPAFYEQIQAEILIAFALGLTIGAVVKMLQKT